LYGGIPGQFWQPPRSAAFYDPWTRCDPRHILRDPTLQPPVGNPHSPVQRGV